MRRFTILLMLLWSISVSGQEYQMDANLSLINDCSGFFTDSGGRLNDYDNRENFTTTICKNPREGTHIRLTFSKIDLAEGDKLCFYDGLTATADSLICIESFFNGIPIIVQATAANTSGCLTVQFTSNASQTGNGWEANLDCVPSCQLIKADISSTTPLSEPIENGYIDICVGENIIFNGDGLYPQNNLVYEQSNVNSIFEWDFGDGTFATGKSVAHTYTEGGGYRVTLKITDQFECTNSNFAQQRVRVATKPNFKIGDLPPTACIGDSIVLSTKIDANQSDAAVAICNQEGSFIFNGFRSDSLALPDGNGASYKTSIRFTDFDSDQVLEDINDLMSICVNMEHSWLHDMEISITCPSGNTVLLQNQEVINKEVYLGNPIDNDGITPMSGRGAEYCWTPRSTNGTITEFANQNDHTSANDTYNLPAGEFESFERLENLLGCPLNGDWVITVTDLWEQDNGWIFSWGLDINPDLYPDLETFQPEIVNFSWQTNSDFINNSDDLVIAQPLNTGNVDYRLFATDNFGCQHDTVVQITILPDNDPACLNCEKGLLKQESTTICAGEVLNLEQFITPNALGTKVTINEPNKTFSFASNPPTAPYENPMQISNVVNPEIRPDGSNLLSVCIDLVAECNSDLNITLISPNGVFLNLSSDNGGCGKGYLNTCFTMDADSSIVIGEKKTFNGNYRPEEPFSKLAESQINGRWILQLSDEIGNDENLLKSWSMTFLSPDGGTFSWSPTDDLSCTDCFDPTAMPTSSTQYILEKNNDGCQVFDTLNVNVLGNDVGLALKEYSLPDGKLLVNWQAIPDVDSYEVSTDNLTWIESNGDFFHIFEGLSQNESINVFVRGVYEEFGCQSAITLETMIYRFCDVKASLGESNLVTNCAGDKDGFAVILAEGGNQSYNFSLYGQNPQSNNRYEQMGAGSYFVLVEDGQGCGDTIAFAITEPAPLNISFDKKDLDCFGDDNGSAKVVFSGGVGGYEILNWSHTNNKTDSLANLSAGMYILTAQDANNCVATDTLELFEPTELQAIASAKPTSCFGKTDGGATVKVTDGTPNYSFIWSDGQTGSAAVNLGIGTYTVTVEDANNCKTEKTVTVTQPDEITISFLELPISCPEETDAALLAQVAGGIAPYEYSWSTGQTNQFTFGLGQDRYFVSVTDQGGCEQTAQINIVDPNPLVLSTSFIPTLCRDQNNGSASVNVVGGTGPYTYLWNDTLKQTSQTAINLGTQVYEVMVTDSFGCTATQMVNVESSSTFEVAVSSNPASCSNRADGSAVVNIMGGIGNYTFLWSNGHRTDTNTGLLPGKYQVTIQDQNGCSIIDSTIISSPEELKLDSLMQLEPDCHGSSTGMLTAIVSGGIGPYNFNWDNAQSTANPYRDIPAGQHTLSVVDQNGCIILPIDVELTEPLPIELEMKTSNVACFGGDNGSADINISGGIAPFNIQWDDLLAQTTTVAIGLSAGDISVAVTDSNGCESNVTQTISQPSEPIITSFIQTDTSCFKENQNHASVTAIGGTGPDYTFSWSTGSNSNDISDLGAGNYEVTTTDQLGCTRVDIFEIVELDSITFSINEVKPTCSDSEDGRLAITPITGGAGGGQMSNYQINWSTEPAVNQEFITDLAGNTVYQVTVTDPIACRQTLSRTLIAPSPISVSLNKQNIDCFGANNGQIRIGEFVSNSNIANYEWSTNVTEGTTILAENLSVGNYSLTVTDEDGCIASATEEIIEPSPIQITSAQLLPNQCSSEEKGQVILALEGGTGDYDFAWSNGSIAQNLLNVASGKYGVLIRDANNCELADSFELVGPNVLSGEVQASPISCEGDSDGRLIVSTNGGVPPYQYSLDGIEYNGIQNIVGLNVGNYSVFIKDDNECVWQSNQISIEEPTPFEVEISTEKNNIELGDSIELVANFQNNKGNIQWDWVANTPNTFDCRDNLCAKIKVAPIANTIYELYAIDDNGCEASDAMTILVAKSQKVFVPTGFTPNGDGENDYLVVHGREGIKINSFKIFDRWGETIYEGYELTVNNIKNTWDGSFKGEPLNGGVYVWLMEVSFPDGSTEIYKGNTTLIK